MQLKIVAYDALNNDNGEFCKMAIRATLDVRNEEDDEAQKINGLINAAAIIFVSHNKVTAIGAGLSGRRREVVGNQNGHSERFAFINAILDAHNKKIITLKDNDLEKLTGLKKTGGSASELKTFYGNYLNIVVFDKIIVFTERPPCSQSQDNSCSLFFNELEYNTKIPVEIYYSIPLSNRKPLNAAGTHVANTLSAVLEVALQTLDGGAAPYVLNKCFENKNESEEFQEKSKVSKQKKLKFSIEASSFEEFFSEEYLSSFSSETERQIERAVMLQEQEEGQEDFYVIEYSSETESAIEKIAVEYDAQQDSDSSISPDKVLLDRLKHSQDYFSKSNESNENFSNFSHDATIINQFEGAQKTEEEKSEKDKIGDPEKKNERVSDPKNISFE